MTKCDFCTKSSPSGKCFYSLQSSREDYCEQAIKRMVEALKNSTNKEVKNYEIKRMAKN